MLTRGGLSDTIGSTLEIYTIATQTLHRTIRYANI